MISKKRAKLSKIPLTTGISAFDIENGLLTGFILILFWGISKWLKIPVVANNAEITNMINRWEEKSKANKEL